MYQLKGFDDSRLFSARDAQPRRIPGYWTDDFAGWFQLMFKMAFYLTTKGYNTDPNGAISVFQRAVNPNAQWEANNKFATISVAQIRDIQAYLAQNPSKYASIILRSPVGFFLLSLAAAAFIDGSGDLNQGIRPVVAFITNSLFKQLKASPSAIHYGNNKAMALNIVNALNSQGYSNPELWSNVDALATKGIKGSMSSTIGFMETRQLIGNYLMSPATIPDLDNAYLLKQAGSQSTSTTTATVNQQAPVKQASAQPVAQQTSAQQAPVKQASTQQATAQQASAQDSMVQQTPEQPIQQNQNQNGGKVKMEENKQAGTEKSGIQWWHIALGVGAVGGLAWLTLGGKKKNQPIGYRSNPFVVSDEDEEYLEELEEEEAQGKKLHQKALKALNAAQSKVKAAANAKQAVTAIAAAAIASKSAKASLSKIKNRYLTDELLEKSEAVTKAAIAKAGTFSTPSASAP